MFGEWVQVLRLETERLSLHTEVPSREGPFTLMLRSFFSFLSSGLRLASMSALLLVGASASALAFSPVASAQSAPAPKAYVGLFKDNAVAVLDTGTNQILSTIPVPTGPHGIVITPDGRWVYVWGPASLLPRLELGREKPAQLKRFLERMDLKMAAHYAAAEEARREAFGRGASVSDLIS